MEGGEYPSHKVLLTPRPTADPFPKRTEAKGGGGGELQDQTEFLGPSGVAWAMPLSLVAYRMGALSRDLVKGIN